MSITRVEIDHIAELSRLDLSDEEKDKFGAQMEATLKYIERLNEVNTEAVESTAQVSGLTNVWREDEVKDWDVAEVDFALSQGELEGRQVKVKRVL